MKISEITKNYPLDDGISIEFVNKIDGMYQSIKSSGVHIDLDEEMAILYMISSDVLNGRFSVDFLNSEANKIFKKIEEKTREFD